MVKQTILRKIVKAAIGTGTISLVTCVPQNSIVLQQKSIIDEITAIKNISYQLIADKKALIISHDNLMKAIDSNKLSKKTVKLINDSLFNISFKQANDGEVIELNF
jgi:hypothetical protein